MRLIIFTIFLCSFWACEQTASFDAAALRSQKATPANSQAEKDRNQILDYAIENQLSVQSTPSGLYYVIEEPGTGEAFDQQSQSTVHYTVSRLKDGFETLSTRKNDKPYVYSAGNNVIQGMKEAIALLKQGGKGKFFIPSGLAHGSRGAGNFYPPNTVLIYEMEVIQLEKKEDQTLRQKEKDEKLIDAYLEKQKLSLQKTKEGVHYEIKEEGKGKHPALKDKVRIVYAISFLDGFVLKEDTEDTLEVGNSLEFWKYTLPLLKANGSGRFVIPSYLAFGNRAVGNVPANSCLVLDCKLLEIE